jgi:hypothetical protein
MAGAARSCAGSIILLITPRSTGCGACHALFHPALTHPDSGVTLTQKSPKSDVQARSWTRFRTPLADTTTKEFHAEIWRATHAKAHECVWLYGEFGQH